MYDLVVPVAVLALGTVALALVYVVSTDPGRRARALQVLKLLLPLRS